MCKVIAARQQTILYGKFNPLKKVFLLLLGLFMLALGVALSIKADLGVSPISCVPYVYSLTVPLTVGELTIFFNALFILMQMVLLRRDYQLKQLVQLPALCIMGYFVDLTLYLCSGITPTSYFEQILWCLLSCITVGFGVFLEVKSKLTYLPVEGLIVVIVDLYRKKFGSVKIIIDCSMVAFGILSSFLFMGALSGIREGTFISALLIGYCVSFFNNKLSIVEHWLENKTAGTEEEETGDSVFPEIS